MVGGEDNTDKYSKMTTYDLENTVRNNIRKEMSDLSKKLYEKADTLLDDTSLNTEEKVKKLVDFCKPYSEKILLKSKQLKKEVETRLNTYTYKNEDEKEDLEDILNGMNKNIGYYSTYCSADKINSGLEAMPSAREFRKLLENSNK